MSSYGILFHVTVTVTELVTASDFTIKTWYINTDGFNYFAIYIYFH